MSSLFHINTSKLLACTAASIALVATSSPDALAGAPVTYKTQGDFFNGCFNQCHCLVTLISPVEGTFRMNATKLTPNHSAFDVTDVNWNLTTYQFAYTGSGTYDIFSDFAVTHTMRLDLAGGDEGEIVNYHNEIVLSDGFFPEIDLQISQNDMSCVDTVFTFEAHPVFGDITGNALVDVDDLLALIDHWGDCDKDCSADISPEFSGDNIVNVDDLLLVIDNWG